ncbi:carotenoid-cleaving dioxygenase, mitochondrial-like [Ptychodera flava]|uniref:carotenoid-cleaving dioxygenase, mitochondrial-like n=1 Tax=Ptychodera flava TaxID=63121 RepID=UPI00396A79A0
MSVETEKPDLRVFWESVQEEQPEPRQTKIRGEIPKWIEGSLYRNGPGLFEIGKDSFRHLFDGMALLHRYHIKDGQVTYQSQFLRSDSYNKNMAANRIVCTEFGTIGHPDPCRNIFQRMASHFQVPTPGDNCMVNFMHRGDELFALSESQYIRKINKETLDSTKDDKINISKYVAVNTATAHPHCTEDGTHFNLGSSVGVRCKYNIVKIEPPTDGAPDKRRWSVLCSILASHRNPSYYHSFGMTENYIVFVEQPLFINVLKTVTSGIRRKSVDDWLEYRPRKKTLFHLVDRLTGEHVATKYAANAFLFFHQINAYEEDGHVVVDLCCYDSTEVIRRGYLESLRKGLSPSSGVEGRRFVLPLNVDKVWRTPDLVRECLKFLWRNVWSGVQIFNFRGANCLKINRFILTSLILCINDHFVLQGTDRRSDNLVTLPNTTCTAVISRSGTVFCTPEKLSSEGFEMPQINYGSYNGKPYQYIYAVRGDCQGLIKVDVKNKTYKSWTEEGFVPSEPVFVEAPSAVCEDDGVVLSAVVNSDPDKPNFLVVLDGKDFTEIGRAEIDHQIPFGTHGLFLPNV